MHTHTQADTFQTGDKVRALQDRGTHIKKGEVYTVAMCFDCLQITTARRPFVVIEEDLSHRKGEDKKWGLERGLFVGNWGRVESHDIPPGWYVSDFELVESAPSPLSIQSAIEQIRELQTQLP